jgi:hypothetical protein
MTSCHLTIPRPYRRSDHLRWTSAVRSAIHVARQGRVNRPRSESLTRSGDFSSLRFSGDFPVESNKEVKGFTPSLYSFLVHVVARRCAPFHSSDA